MSERCGEYVDLPGDTVCVCELREGHYGFHFAEAPSTPEAAIVWQSVTKEKLESEARA